MFIVSGIILKKTPIRDKKTLIILFTEEFWIIHVWYKKPPTWLETGWIIQAYIDRKNSISILDSFHVKKQILYEQYSYTSLLQFLWLIKILLVILPEWLPQQKIFQIYNEIISWDIPEESFCNFIKLRIIQILKHIWIIDPRLFIWENQANIYTYIDKIEIKRILFSEKITIDDFWNLNNIIQHSLLPYTNYQC